MNTRPLIDTVSLSLLRYFDPEGGFGVLLLILWLGLVLGGCWFLFL